MKAKLSLAPQRLCEIFDECNKAGSTTRKRTLMSQTQGLNLFEMLGLDFARPIRCRGKGKTERKACLVLYGCSLSRAAYLQLLNTLETDEFFSSLKCFIVRHGRVRNSYTADNGTTFKAAAKWLKRIQCDEHFYLR